MDEKRFDYLDGWRGLAIAFLLIGHFFPIPGINLGHVGVNLFFVLSGALMARLLFIKNVPIVLFYKRRISRIFPVLFFFLVLITLLRLLTGLAIDWTELGAAALLVNNYIPGVPGKSTMPFGHFWSLSVEEHSYILLSVIAIAVRRKWMADAWSIGVFALLFFLIGILYWFRYDGTDLAYLKWLHSEVSAFGIFASGFFLLLLRQKKAPVLPLIVYPFLFVFALMMHWWSVPNPIKMIMGVGIFALLVNLLHSAPKLIQSFLSFLPLRQLGLWSFSIYVWQQPFYLYMHLGKVPAWLACSLAMLAGITSFYLIENPLRNFLNRIWADDKVSRNPAIVLAKT